MQCGCRTMRGRARTGNARGAGRPHVTLSAKYAAVVSFLNRYGAQVRLSVERAALRGAEKNMYSMKEQRGTVRRAQAAGESRRRAACPTGLAAGPPKPTPGDATRKPSVSMLQPSRTAGSVAPARPAPGNSMRGRYGPRRQRRERDSCGGPERRMYCPEMPAYNPSL